MIPNSEKCSWSDCLNAVKSKGLCSKHYEYKRRGNPIANTNKAKRKSATHIHILSKIDKNLMTANCKNCGTVSVYYRKDKNVYGCSSAKKREQADYMLRRTYGVSFEEKEIMLKNQGMACAICSEAIDMFQSHLDHEHSSGKIRGVLCGKCNKGLGLFQDNENLLLLASRYLSNYSSGK